MTRQQRQFVEMLRAAGARGVHTFEMRAAYIGNPSQRRAELEALGYVLRVGPRERLNGDALGVRYFLVSEPSAVSSTEYTIEDRGYSTPCWIWARCVGTNGYGKVRDGGEPQQAHRVYYERAHGPIPGGLPLDHLCRVTTCVNPDHLEPVTTAENNRRSSRTKLTAKQVAEIKASPLSYTQLAARYGVSKPAIADVKKGRSWADIEPDQTAAPQLFDTTDQEFDYMVPRPRNAIDDDWSNAA